MPWWIFFWGCGLARESGSGTFCRPALVVAAHADDEVLYAGEALHAGIDGTAATCWHVVVATTGADGGRRAALKSALSVLDRSVTFDHWNFTDGIQYIRFGSPQKFAELQVLLDGVLRRRAWQAIVTHSDQGEYGHPQHRILGGLVREMAHALGFEHCLFVFHPVPELGVLPSAVKTRALLPYLLREDQGVEIQVLWTEFLVRPHLFPRPVSASLGLGTGGPPGAHFAYSSDWEASTEVDSVALGKMWNESLRDGCGGLLTVVAEGVRGPAI
mmetsp:Transcript_113016/g.258875  ORF Transcript_113016/g.258875 Transcript_113016/m.258875 type:complete len:272 (-) Transcript_113016:938-1753(-)